MNNFKVLECLSNCFASHRFIVDTVGLASITKIEVAKKNHHYKLEKVGLDMCFTVMFDDMVVDSIMSLPEESEEQYSTRIVWLVFAHG